MSYMGYTSKFRGFDLAGSTRLAAAARDLTVSGIQAFDILRVSFFLIGRVSPVETTFIINFNGDATANYDWEWVFHPATMSQGIADTSIDPGSNDVVAADRVGSFVVLNLAATPKVFQGTYESLRLDLFFKSEYIFGGQWRNASDRISSIRFRCADPTGLWSTDSMVVVEGITP